MKSIRSIAPMALVVLLAATGGCASFRGDALDGPASLPGTGSPKSLRIVLTGKTNINNRLADAAPAFIKAWTDGAVAAYRDSGLFAEVSDGIGDSDIRAEIALTNGGDGNMALAFLSGFTFLVIPARAIDRISLKTTFIDREGSVLGTYEKDAQMTTWFHLFMIPLMPFRFPGVVGPQMFQDLHRATLAQAKADGVV